MQEVFADGAAAKDGKLKAGDELVIINGKEAKEMTHSDAKRTIFGAKDKVLSPKKQNGGQDGGSKFL